VSAWNPGFSCTCVCSNLCGGMVGSANFQFLLLYFCSYFDVFLNKNQLLLPCVPVVRYGGCSFDLLMPSFPLVETQLKYLLLHTLVVQSRKLYLCDNNVVHNAHYIKTCAIARTYAKLHYVHCQSPAFVVKPSTEKQLN